MTDVGFLGAGTILNRASDSTIKGLTTAGSVWVTAAIGVAAGLGQIAVTMVAAVFAWLVLSILVKLEGRMNPNKSDNDSACAPFALLNHHWNSNQMRHAERHRTHRINWLRAAVLGANDGLISTASLMLGIAASGANSLAIMTTGFAGLVAGAASMAAGEYVSVSAQSDTERADLDRERRELAADFGAEQRELATIFVGRGLGPELAVQVAEQLMARDALGAHAREELGLLDITGARPIQAAVASAASFSVGAAMPLIITMVTSERHLTLFVAGITTVLLALLGGFAAKTGGAPAHIGAVRVTFWGLLAMGLTTAAGRFAGMLAA